jgi:hypothetical protein
MTEFGTYQGAFTIRRKTFDRKRSKIVMLEFEVMPPRWMPYVQDGFEYCFVDEEFVADRDVRAWVIDLYE